MEGRIEIGYANLSTSSLYYGALQYNADLASSSGKGRKTSSQIKEQASALSKSIEKYFGSAIEG